VPVHVIPCVEGRTDHAPVVVQASRWGSIIPAAWSFMLAARARGLGGVWTTFHLRHERQAAELLGIPFDKVMQAALIPIAYTVGTDFRPAARHPLDTMSTGSGGGPAGSRPTDDPPGPLGAPFGDVAGNMSPCHRSLCVGHPGSRPWGPR
jgi:hypothetical protein